MKLRKEESQGVKIVYTIQGDEHAALLTTAIFTGMRSGELIGLTWDCIVFENGIIWITNNLFSRARKEQVFLSEHPKTEKKEFLLQLHL